MRCFVLSNDDHWKEFFASSQAVEAIWIPRKQCKPGLTDILFDMRDDAWDLELYRAYPDHPIFISAVRGTLAEHDAPSHVVRINGWAGMLRGPKLECVADPSVQLRAEEILERVNKTPEWLPDRPGMVSPRILAMIINEAWYALEEQVSSREDIDTAMQLGTNYPYGPFAWGDKIGLKKIVALLQTLEKEDGRYAAASLLLKEALK